MTAAVERSNFLHIQPIAHSLHLIIINGLKICDTDMLLTKCRKIIGVLNTVRQM